MLTAFWDCAIRFSKGWSALSSAVAILLGVLKNMGFEVPLISAVPAWVWWLGAIVILFVSAVFLEMSLQKEKDKNRAPRPNMKLEDVVKRIRGKDDIFGPENSESAQVLQALTLIRESAHNGALTIFGSKEVRYVKPEHHEFAISRMAIPPEFWKTYTFDYIAFTSNRDGITKPIGRPDDRSMEYEYIWLDRDQVDSLWPPPRKRIEWQNPIRFKQSV
jgi:hypothetical protein